MPTLLLSASSLPAAQALAHAARGLGWRTFALDETPSPEPAGRIVFYGGTDVAADVAARFGLALLEPPLDLLARLPLSLRFRQVEYRRFGDLRGRQGPAFVKPADPSNKIFDAGVYPDVANMRLLRPIDPETPVLVAEPVEWLAEYRCFILEGRVAATSAYMSFGRPVWQPYSG